MLSKMVKRLDGWANLLTGLGILSRDKRQSTQYTTPTEMTYADLDNLYRGNWLAARACNRIASEMVRKWIEVKTGDDVDAGKEILQKMDKLKVKPAFREANIWAYLYGGSLILMGIDDGQTVDKPLNEDKIRGIEYLRVLDRYSVSVAGRYTSAEMPGQAGMPSSYYLNTAVDAAGIPMEPIHESRFLRFDGVTTPLRRRISNDMWCDGIVTRLFESIRMHGTAWGGIEHLLTDFSQAVFKMKGLGKMLDSDANEEILARMTQMDMARSICRMIPLDAELEDFERKPTPINGLGPVMQIMMDYIAGVVEMPVSVLFGKATPGIGDTGNSQMDQWYDRVAEEQEDRIVPQGSILMRHVAVANGRDPGDWSVDPRPLREMSEKEEADIHKTQAEADVLMINNGVVSEIEVRRSRYGGDEYSLNTTLDESMEDMLQVGNDLQVPLDEPMPEPEPGPRPLQDPQGVDPQKTAMNGAQVKALSDLLVAYNTGDLTKEQAAGVLEVGFLLGAQEAIRLVGEREEKPDPPAQLQPFAEPGPQLPPQPDPDDSDRRDANLHEDYVKSVGDKWVVFSKSGKKLGEHGTKKEADRQLRAIEAAKVGRNR